MCLWETLETTVSRKLNTNGNFIKQWSHPIEVTYFDVWGIAVDKSSNVYGVQLNPCFVQKFDGNGNFISVFGEYGSLRLEQLYHPYDVTVDFSGNVYVADTGNYRVQKYDMNYKFVTKWGSEGSGEGQFSDYFRFIAVDGSGNVYTSDEGNCCIQKFTGDGTFIKKWGISGSAGEQYCPSGIVVDSSGNVFVAVWNNKNIFDVCIMKFDGNGNFITKFGSGGYKDGQFPNPGM